MLLAFDPALLIVVVFVVVFGLFFISFGRFFNLWLRAFLTRVPVSFPELVLMQMRKVDPRAVVDALILARQSGVEISCRQMERAYLQGADLQKLTLAMIEAQKQGLSVTFQDLVDAELQDQLYEKLQGES